MGIPISNAKDIPLNKMFGSLPNLNDALQGYFQPLTFDQIVKTIVNFQNVETTTSTTFQGVRQPFTAQQLMMKPEGQRQWAWETIHADPSLALNIDDIIFFNSVKYRVMQKLNWTEYGYVEYHIAQDYT